MYIIYAIYAIYVIIYHLLLLKSGSDLKAVATKL